jgi:hypothetical protein
MDLLVGAFSNCPQELSACNGWKATAVRVIIYDHGGRTGQSSIGSSSRVAWEVWALGADRTRNRLRLGVERSRNGADSRKDADERGYEIGFFSETIVLMRDAARER